MIRPKRSKRSAPALLAPSAARSMPIWPPRPGDLRLNSMRLGRLWRRLRQTRNIVVPAALARQSKTLAYRSKFTSDIPLTLNLTARRFYEIQLGC